MDENTITEYGWIVAALLVVAVAFIAVTASNGNFVQSITNQISSYFEKNDEMVSRYSEEDVNASGGLLVPIGKNDPMNVIARFNNDRTAVIITKNGAESDGVMMDNPGINDESLVSVTICAGVANIGQDAFSGCDKLKGIDIVPSVSSISSGALSDCSNLSNIVYSGTKEQWDDISFTSGWNQNTGAYVVEYAN